MILFFFIQTIGEKGIEGLSEYPYLLVLMRLWTGDWESQMEIMNMTLDEDNGKAVRIRKIRD